MSLLYRSRFSSYGRPLLIAGLALLIVSICGVVHALRASVAAAVYHRVRYHAEQRSRGDPEWAGMVAERSYRFYPYNYYLCAWIAENFWYYRFNKSGEELSSRVTSAEIWCNRGLEQNSWKSQLRLLKVRLVARESPSAALESWKEYMDWDYWNRYNHAVLVELYARAGDFSNAMEALERVKGTKHHNYARRELHAAWQKEFSRSR